MNGEPIRVLIVDDHDVVRLGLRALIAEHDDMDVVGEAANGLEAIRLVESAEPDVVLMDLVMPVMGGTESIARISTLRPRTRILVISTYSGDDLVFPAIKAGAHGYLLKDSGSDEVVEAIRKVHQGEPSLHPDIARKLMHELRPAEPDSVATDPLTARELEVLTLLARGLSNQEIAEQLVVAEVTVRSHISRILNKLHLANRVQATLYALRDGLVDLEETP
jgi:NarL family two-component system response regulator LiaR